MKTYVPEMSFGTNPAVADPDTDKDGLPDDYERNISRTDPNDYDSDDDGYIDGWEVDHGYDPLDKTDPDLAGDDDNDGLTNKEEYEGGTGPKNAEGSGPSDPSEPAAPEDPVGPEDPPVDPVGPEESPAGQPPPDSLSGGGNQGEL